MNTYKCVYIAIDLHSNHSMVGYMNDKGKYMGQRELRTTPENLIGEVAARKTDQLERVTQTGEQFWEIAEFQKMTGIGPVGAHTFSAYIQTPHRFSGRSQLIRFCQLGVAKRSSGGTPLGREPLDKAGHIRLKQVSYVA